jgi:hypothetical protein
VVAVVDIAVPLPPPLVRIPHVELIHTGTWPISTGVWTATRGDLQAAVAALDCPAIHRAGLKIGHVDQRFTDPGQDGEPLLGYVDNLAGEDDWNTLVGDFAGVPAWLGAIDSSGNSVISSAYPQRSIEGIHDFRCQIGHTHPFVLTAVALLGVTHPGVGTLQSLPDLMALFGVAASAGAPNGVTVRAAVHDIPLIATTQADAGPGERSTMPNPSPTKVAAGVTTEDVRREYYEAAPSWDWWITEFHLEPLQLIVCDDRSGKHYRVPVNLTAEDAFEFGEPTEVLVRYIDAQSDTTVAASAADKRLVYASRAESRPGDRPAAANDPVEVQPVEPDGDPVQTEPAAVEPITPEAPDVAPENVPAAEPDATTNQEDSMSLSAIRARLGLGDDADEAAVLAALEAKLPTETGDGTPDTPAVQPDLVPVAAASTKPKLPEGVVAIDEATLNELRRNASLGAQAAERQRVSDRDRVIDAAIGDGRIPPARKDHWVKAWEADPDGAKGTLASLEPGLVPVVMAGSTGSGEESVDTDGFGDTAMAEWAADFGIDVKELARG